MVDRIGSQTSLAQAAIEAALKRQSAALERMTQAGASAPEAAPALDFASALKGGMGEIDAQVKRADALALDVATGKITDFHEVAAALKQSELSLRFALEVRNKFIDAYREVMRMSV